MKLYDFLAAGHVNNGDYNCAEKIITGANEAYGLNLSKRAMKLAAGFGLGMGICYTCGVVTAGVMVLSDLFVSEYAHESKRIHALSGEFIRRIEAELGCVHCKDLRGKYRTKEAGCRHVILKAAQILDEIVERERGL